MVSYIAQPVERPAPARIFDTVAYAFVGLLLRLVMARAVFLAGQSRIAGPSFTLGSEQASFTVTLPAHVREEAVRAFETQFGAASIWPSVVAYFFAYAEFILPVCLVIGFGTRMAAFILLLMTAAMQIYIDPGALWTTHVYWASILLVLLACGPGAISLDRIIRYLYRQ